MREFLFKLLLILIFIVVLDHFIKRMERMSSFTQHPGNRKNISQDKEDYVYKFTTLQEDFHEEVRQILASSGWKNKYNFIEALASSDKYDIGIGLLPREVMEKGNTLIDYYPDGSRIYFSRTWMRRPRQIEIDDVNWYKGVKQSGLTIPEYKEYVINHEVGHALGYDHRVCDTKKCPIMYQMTRGPPPNHLPSFQVEWSDIDFTRTLN
jgi:hypothetical protein